MSLGSCIHIVYDLFGCIPISCKKDEIKYITYGSTGCEEFRGGVKNWKYFGHLKEADLTDFGHVSARFIFS